jgi:hypothetical protein
MIAKIHSSLLALVVLAGLPLGTAHSTAELNKMRTFGTGKSEFLITADETVLFEHNVSDNNSYGVFTHFWITGSPAAGGGCDNATVRYYIDGEETASIEFKPPLATGVGFDDLSLWGTEKAGHGAKSGAWNVNYRIPFQRSAKVTLQHWTAPNSSSPQIGYAIVRGAENIPILVGVLFLPGLFAPPPPPPPSAPSHLPPLLGR